MSNTEAMTHILQIVTLATVEKEMEHAQGPLQKDIQNIEMVQQHAAHWVKADYRYNNCVTSVLSDLQWPSLQHHQYITRLKLLFTRHQFSEYVPGYL